jgi:hypothetical protein
MKRDRPMREDNRGRWGRAASREGADERHAAAEGHGSRWRLVDDCPFVALNAASPTSSLYCPQDRAGTPVYFVSVYIVPRTGVADTYVYTVDAAIYGNAETYKFYTWTQKKGSVAPRDCAASTAKDRRQAVP